MTIPTLHQEHAHHPGDRGNAAGRTHLVLDAPLVANRLRMGSRLCREARDPLCKPRAKFWGLYEGETRPEHQVCKRCREIAQRLGLTVREGQSP